MGSFAGRDTARFARLYAASGAAAWGVSEETFADALERSVARRWAGEHPSDRDVARYLDGLAVADLALACACRDGQERAWDRFVEQYRPVLYASARAIAGESGRELADSVYADLYGLDASRADRRSLFSYYHGRSSLAAWLRAVLARRHIDRVREHSRTDPLDESDPVSSAPASTLPGPADPRRDEYVRAAQASVDAAIAALEGPDRLRLRLYYAEGLTLAEIGRVFGEHEATVSRRLSRLRRSLRGTIERELRARHGFDESSVRLCFEYAADAPELHLTRLLSTEER